MDRAMKAKLEENRGRIAADPVREDCSRSDGWCAGPETEFEAEPGEKAEGCTREKHSRRK